jgi:hypothetical protein
MITQLVSGRLLVITVLSILSTVAGAQPAAPADATQTDASAPSDTMNQIPPWWSSQPNTANDVQQGAGQPNCQTQNCFQSYTPPPPQPPTTFNWNAACGSLGWMGTGLSAVGAPEAGVPLGYASSACKVAFAGATNGVNGAAQQTGNEVLGTVVETAAGGGLTGAGARTLAEGAMEAGQSLAAAPGYSSFNCAKLGQCPGANSGTGYASGSASPPPQPFQSSPQPALQPMGGFGGQPVDAPPETMLSSPTPSSSPNSTRPLDDAIDAPTDNAPAQTASGSSTPGSTPGTTSPSADQTQGDDSDDLDAEDKRARRAAISSIKSGWSTAPLGPATHNVRKAAGSPTGATQNSRTQAPGVLGRQSP